MNCTFNQDDWDARLDDWLDADRARAFEAHLPGCAACQDGLKRAKALRIVLRSQPVPAATDDFLAGALERAQARAVAQRGRRAVVRAGVSSALAAGLLVFLATAFWFRGPTPAGDVAQVTMAVNDMRTVNLVFAADMPLEGVTLTVQLPPGIEVEGFAGQRELSWGTRLVAGNNVLALPLVAVGAGGGSLVAALELDGERKTFVVNIDVS